MNHTKIQGNGRWSALLLLLLTAFFLFVTSTSARATDDSKIVRVGVYELEGFHSFESGGDCVGYDVDYLNRISNVTGWTYKYVKASSWSQAIEMLRTGKIDLLSPSQMTTERLEEFRFSTFPIGKVYAAILTTKDSNAVYEDFEAFSQMTFGIESGNTYKDIFEDYAKSNGFTANIHLYGNHAQLVDALNKGQVDAIVANVMRAESGMRLLGKAGTAQFYYMYRKDDAALGNALNDALDQIEIDEPNFQSELVSTYFPIYNEEPFSKSELDYVKALPTIRVACPADARPYAFPNEKTGEMEGIIIDYLTQAGNAVGMKYEFVPLDGVVDDAFLEENQIHLVVESGLSPMEKNRGKGIYSNNILDTQQLIVCSPDVHFSMDDNLRIGWYGVNNIGSRLMQNSFPNFTWTAYESAEACFEALKQNEMDGCMVNQFAANWYLAKPRYENFVMVANSSIAQSICLRSGVESKGLDPEDTTFFRILNKSFKQISDIQEQQITIKYTTAMPYKLTATETLYRYRYAIILLSLLIAIVVAGLIGYARNRNTKAQRDQMTGLYNRTAARRLITKQITSKQYTGGVMIVLDLDHFKSVNDTLGHQAGDKLLIESAAVLKNCCRSDDIVFRLGGDEFSLYLPCNDPSAFLLTKLEQIRTNLKRDVAENGKIVHVSCSIGVALAPRDGTTMEELYKHADEALYKAKENGRDGYVIYGEMDKET